RGSLGLADFKLGAKPTGRIVQPIFLFEVEEQLLDEEGISFSLGMYLAHDGRRGRFSAQAFQHRGHSIAWKNTECHARRKAPWKRSFQNVRQSPSEIELGVAVGANYHQLQIGKPLRQVIEQRQRRIICPVKVFEDHQCRALGSDARSEVENATEQVASCLS